MQVFRNVCSLSRRSFNLAGGNSHRVCTYWDNMEQGANGGEVESLVRARGSRGARPPAALGQ